MTQVGEAVAVAPPDLDEDDKKEKPCRFIVRVKRPSGDGPWYAFGMLGGQDDDYTGHTFCAHEDEGGSRKWNGFYPKGAIVGWENVPEKDQIGGFLDLFRYVAGYLYHGDQGHEYDDEKVYEIPRANYDAAERFAAKWESDSTTYNLALRNCTTFVVRDAGPAGCSVPWSGWPFANPAGFGKRLAGAK
jgi:hypothetical protein